MKIKTKALMMTSIAMIIVAFLSGCNRSEIVARVNGMPIVKETYEKRLTMIKASYMPPKGNRFYKNFNSAKESPEALAIYQLVNEALERQEAERRGIQPDEEEVKRRVQKIKSDYGVYFGRMLKYRGISEEELAERIEFDLLHKKLYEEITKDVKSPSRFSKGLDFEQSLQVEKDRTFRDFIERLIKRSKIELLIKVR